MPPKKVNTTSKESTFRAKVRKQILKKKTPADELDYEIEAEYEPDGSVEHEDIAPEQVEDIFETRLTAVEKKFMKALEEFKAAQEKKYQEKENAAALAKEERRKKKMKEQEDLLNERLAMQKKDIQKEFNEKLKTHRNISNQLDSLVRKRHNTFGY